ncbi:MAG: hypothetical protein B0W54_23460 [Cellvibrio sp. 79]|nr:MAG: hypothetical protein B0W54_23460 [Cellvibrio sp. 79]
MKMLTIRIAIVIFGILLPYIARIPGGSGWLHQYTGNDIGGFLFIGVFNAIAWGAVLSFTFLYKYKRSVIAPVLFGFVPLAWVHSVYDISSDAQAGVGLVFIPIYALAPIAVGGVIGYLIDRYLIK